MITKEIMDIAISVGTIIMMRRIMYVSTTVPLFRTLQKSGPTSLDRKGFSASPIFVNLLGN